MRVLIAAVIGLLIGAAIIAASGFNPGDAFRAMFTEAFGSPEGVASVVGDATPLLILSIGFAVAFRAGLFNIGGEGQFVMGAISAALVGHTAASLPAVLLVPLVMLSGILAGGVWAGIAAWMKSSRNVHEVVSTIMLNWVALKLANYLINYTYGPMRDVRSESPQSFPIGHHAMLPTLYPTTNLHAGVVVALLLIPLTAWFLSRSVWGFEIRAVGKNPLAARTYGISDGRVLMRAMFISGALAGLAGAMELMGVSAYAGALKPDFAAGRGFDGITVALMGAGGPYGIAAAALFLSALRLGAVGMQSVTGVPKELSLIVQGVLILAVTTPVLAEFVKSHLKKRSSGPTGGTGSDKAAVAGET